MNMMAGSRRPEDFAGEPPAKRQNVGGGGGPPGAAAAGGGGAEFLPRASAPSGDSAPSLPIPVHRTAPPPKPNPQFGKGYTRYRMGYAYPQFHGGRIPDEHTCRMRDREHESGPELSRDEDGLWEFAERVSFGPELAYTSKELLHRGKNAVIFSAEHELGGRPETIVIKMFKWDPLISNYGQHEADLLGALTAEDDKKRDTTQGETKVPPGFTRSAGWFWWRGHVCVVLEAMVDNGHKMLTQFGSRRGSVIGLSLQAVRLWGRSLFQGLVALHSKELLHGSLDLHHILITKNKKAANICDFSKCRNYRDIGRYRSTLAYSLSNTAPELLLEVKSQLSFGLDIWAAGCILYELYKGMQLFPGASTLEVFNLHRVVLGACPEGLMETSTSDLKHLSQTGILGESQRPNQNGTDTAKPLGELLAGNKDGLEQFRDLLTRCLEQDPEKRITARDAMDHPALA